MPKCKKHPNSEIKNGVYYRAANIKNPKDWVPKSESTRNEYYKIAAEDNLEMMAKLIGEAQMIHSNESSENSGYVSVARCPICLSQSTDPCVKKLLQVNQIMLRFNINPKNKPGYPYVFDIGGDTLGATETESLVLLPQKKSLLDYHDGYVTKGYLNSMR